jgi:hypothetical protein
MDEHTTATKPRVVVDVMNVPVQLQLSITESDVTERDVAPGRLLSIVRRVRALTKPVPPGFAVEDGLLARMTQSRAIEASGLFVRGTAVCETEGAASAAFLSVAVGAPPGGKQLQAEQVLAWVTEAIAAGRFSVADVERFASDPRALAVLRSGVLARVAGFVAGLPDHEAFYAAAAKAGVAPGFTAALGADGFAEYLELHARQLDVAGLLSLPGEIGRVAP